MMNFCKKNISLFTAACTQECAANKSALFSSSCWFLPFLFPLLLFPFFFLVCLKVTEIQNIFLILSFGLKWVPKLSIEILKRQFYVYCLLFCLYDWSRFHPSQSAIRMICEPDLFEWAMTK